MAAATINLGKSATGDSSIEQGSTYRATITWKTGATVAAALPVNITGYTARAMFKASPIKADSRIISISKANPGVVTTEGPHKLVTGQSVVLPGVGGMTELSSRYTVTRLTDKTFSIGVDTTAYTTYTSGGTVAYVSLVNQTAVSGLEGLILGTTGGTIEIYIKDTTTDIMPAGGVYDLELISGAAPFDVTRVAQGTFVATNSVTR